MEINERGCYILGLGVVTELSKDTYRELSWENYSGSSQYSKETKAFSFLFVLSSSS